VATSEPKPPSLGNMLGTIAIAIAVGIGVLGYYVLDGHAHTQGSSP